MISKGITSLNIHEVVRGICILGTICSAGYMIEDFPREFLDQFTNYYTQFILFLALNYASRRHFRVSEIKWILVESFLSVCILQLFKYFLNLIYN